MSSRNQSLYQNKEKSYTEANNLKLFIYDTIKTDKNGGNSDSSNDNVNEEINGLKEIESQNSILRIENKVSYHKKSDYDSVNIISVEEYSNQDRSNSNAFHINISKNLIYSSIDKNNANIEGTLLETNSNNIKSSIYDYSSRINYNNSHNVDSSINFSSSRTKRASISRDVKYLSSNLSNSSNNNRSNSYDGSGSKENRNSSDNDNKEELIKNFDLCLKNNFNSSNKNINKIREYATKDLIKADTYNYKHIISNQIESNSYNNKNKIEVNSENININDDSYIKYKLAKRSNTKCACFIF